MFFPSRISETHCFTMYKEECKKTITVFMKLSKMYSINLEIENLAQARFLFTAILIMSTHCEAYILFNNIKTFLITYLDPQIFANSFRVIEAEKTHFMLHVNVGNLHSPSTTNSRVRNLSITRNFIRCVNNHYSLVIFIC